VTHLLLAALAALAAAPAGPAIAPPTVTAQFSASAGNLRFDRACAAVTLQSLAANAGCAARVGRGETGPTIEVIMATYEAAPKASTVAAALPLLDRAIAAEHHPAASYLAGSLLTTGELVQPDYARGLAYLEQAVAGGNIAAADLLGLMVLEGRGTAQDVPRAIRLFEQAAAGGMEGSANRLGLLYLDGQYLPRDVARGRDILERAKAAGVRGAAENLLALDAEARSHNYQIHPSEDPAKIEIRDYKMLEIPPVPPAFGFTDDFRRLHYSAYSDAAALARLERDYPALPTPYIFELARRMAAVSPDKARGYFMVAQLRLQYDIRRCADAQAGEAGPLWSALVARELRSTFTQAGPAQIDAAVAFAFEREAAMPGDTRPWWVCYGGMASYAALAGDKPPPLSLVPQSQWPALRQAVRDELTRMLARTPR
jgi:hypothetical protein